MTGSASEILFAGSALMMVALTRRHRVSRTRCLSTLSVSTPPACVSPPVAAKRIDKMYFGKHPNKPNEFRGHHAMDPPIVRYDAYNWMRDETRKDEKVLSLIREENEYCEQQMAPLTGLKDSIYSSMVGYMKESDEEVITLIFPIDMCPCHVVYLRRLCSQVPYRRGDFYYYTKTVQGLAYKLHCRYHKSLGLLDKAASLDASMGDRSHSVILDENDIAKETEYCDITPICPSPSQNRLMYGVDNNGKALPASSDHPFSPFTPGCLVSLQALKCMMCTLRTWF